MEWSTGWTLLQLSQTKNGVLFVDGPELQFQHCNFPVKLELEQKRFDFWHENPELIFWAWRKTPQEENFEKVKGKRSSSSIATRQKYEMEEKKCEMGFWSEEIYEEEEEEEEQVALEITGAGPL